MSVNFIPIKQTGLRIYLTLVKLYIFVVGTTTRYSSNIYLETLGNTKNQTGSIFIMCLEVQEMTRCLRATFILFVFLLVIQNCESETSKSGDYIIYMGAASADESTGNDHHIDLMSTMLKR